MDLPTPEGRQLDRRYRVERFDESGIDASEVIGMWLDAGALSAGQAAARVRDVVLVAVERDEGVVGVSTAWLHPNAHLRMTLWNYRTFVAPDHRQGDIAFLLLHATRDELSRRYTDGSDRRADGMIMEVQNAILKRTRNQGLWPTSGFTFIGEDERGAHHRVLYFPGAKAPGPPAAGSG